MLIKKNWVASLVIAPVMLAASVPAHALFGDDEARKAILDLREKVEAAQNAQLMLQSQIEALREQNARLTGRIEELANQLTLEQRSNRDLYADLDKRMSRQILKSTAVPFACRPKSVVCTHRRWPFSLRANTRKAKRCCVR